MTQHAILTDTPQTGDMHETAYGTYLGYVGKKLLAEWLAMPPDERRAMVEGWINERHAEKGIG